MTVITILSLAATAALTSGCTSDSADSRSPSASTSTATTLILGTDSPDLDAATKPKEISPAAEEDLAIIGNTEGWTKQESVRYHRISEKMDRLQAKLAEGRPGKYIEAKIGPGPRDLPVIYIRGEVDGFIRQAVEGSGLRVRIVNDIPYSPAEMEKRERRLGDALKKLGYGGFGFSSDTANRGRIDVQIAFHPDLPSTPDYILSQLPDDLASSVDLHMNQDYLDPGTRPAIAAGKRPFGPLAVLEQPSIMHVGVGGPAGTLEITRECVFLVSNNRQRGGTIRTLLGWEARYVSWDAESRSIIHSSSREPDLELHDGDKIEVGGNDGKRESKAWLVPPSKSCAGKIFVVDEVRRP